MCEFCMIEICKYTYKVDPSAFYVQHVDLLVLSIPSICDTTPNIKYPFKSQVVRIYYLFPQTSCNNVIACSDVRTYVFANVMWQVRRNTIRYSCTVIVYDIAIFNCY